MPPELDPNQLGHRLADAYALFIYFKSQFEQLLAHPTQSTEAELIQDNAETLTQVSVELNAISTDTEMLAATETKATSQWDAASLLSGPYRGSVKKKEGADNHEFYLNGSRQS